MPVDKKVSELGSGMCLYKRPDGTVYIAPEGSDKEAEKDPVTKIFEDENEDYGY